MAGRRKYWSPCRLPLTSKEKAVSEWIDKQLEEARKVRDDAQAVIDALDPPKPKRKYTRRKSIQVDIQRSPEQQELDAGLRAKAAK